jgi:excisionase family DNA binding protein
MIEKSSNYGDTSQSRVESVDKASAESPTPATYSTREAAAVIGVCPHTIYRLLQRGKLRAISSIRHKRIPKEQVHKFLRDLAGS